MRCFRTWVHNSGVGKSRNTKPPSCDSTLLPKGRPSQVYGMRHKSVSHLCCFHVSQLMFDLSRRAALGAFVWLIAEGSSACLHLEAAKSAIEYAVRGDCRRLHVVLSEIDDDLVSFLYHRPRAGGRPGLVRASQHSLVQEAHSMTILNQYCTKQCRSAEPEIILRLPDSRKCITRPYSLGTTIPGNFFLREQ